MDTEGQNPPIMPPSTQPPVYGPVGEPASAQPTKPSQSPFMQSLGAYSDKLPKLIGPIIVIVLIVAVAVIWVLETNKTPPQAIPVPVTPTQTPTPTQLPSLSPFATSSAFMNFEQNVTNLPNTIQNAVLLDPALSPPQLTLPLGFSN